jgi:hypothetical protein
VNTVHEIAVGLAVEELHQRGAIDRHLQRRAVSSRSKNGDTKLTPTGASVLSRIRSKAADRVPAPDKRRADHPEPARAAHRGDKLDAETAEGRLLDRDLPANKLSETGAHSVISISRQRGRVAIHFTASSDVGGGQSLSGRLSAMPLRISPAVPEGDLAARRSFAQR